MKMSLRRFIFINLLIGELLATTLGISTVLFLEHQDIQVQTDNKLLESAFTMQNFMNKPGALQKLHTFKESLKTLSDILPAPFYQKAEGTFNLSLFHCYIWDSHGHLLFGSHDLPESYFAKIPLGFSKINYDNNSWRTFTTIDPVTKIKITSLEQASLHPLYHKNLIREVTIVMLTSYVFLGFLMWIVLARGLHVLRKISNQVQQQGPEHLSPLDSLSLPAEIKPIVDEWNKLFDRLKLAFDREKRFAADAAHELKTPLAALKTHTQLALNAKTENERANALHKIIAGVNRSAHVVHQLLTLSRMNQGGVLELPTPVDIVQHAKEIIAEMFPQALDKETEIELIAPANNPIIEAYDTAVAILIRNLVDNGIRYSPERSLVQVIIEESSDKKNVILKVIDNGRGIPEHLRQRVFERFFRVIGNKSSGSGLGLGIVQQIVELHHAMISLETPLSGHGLQVTVMFSKKFAQSAESLV
jgi:two-component system sensor histidine kinase QseC